MLYYIWVFMSSEKTAGACLLEAAGLAPYRLLAYPAIMMVGAADAAAIVTLWVVAVFVFGLTFARARPGLRHFLAGACVAAGGGAITADGIATGHVLLLCASVIYGWYLAKLPH